MNAHENTLAAAERVAFWVGDEHALERARAQDEGGPYVRGLVWRAQCAQGETDAQLALLESPHYLAPHVAWLEKLGACSDGLLHAAQYPTLREAWDACEDESHIQWLVDQMGDGHDGECPRLWPISDGGYHACTCEGCSETTIGSRGQVLRPGGEDGMCDACQGAGCCGGECQVESEYEG